MTHRELKNLMNSLPESCMDNLVHASIASEQKNEQGEPDHFVLYPIQNHSFTQDENEKLIYVDLELGEEQTKMYFG